MICRDTGGRARSSQVRRLMRSLYSRTRLSSRPLNPFVFTLYGRSGSVMREGIGVDDSLGDCALRQSPMSAPCTLA